MRTLIRYLYVIGTTGNVVLRDTHIDKPTAMYFLCPKTIYNIC